MESEEKQVNKSEMIPAGVVTMLLVGYKDTIKKLTYALIFSIFCLLCTVGGFLCYLAQYEVNVSNYGTVENSKINTHTGQQADNMTNYFQGSMNESENKK